MVYFKTNLVFTIFVFKPSNIDCLRIVTFFSCVVFHVFKLTVKCSCHTVTVHVISTVIINSLIKSQKISQVIPHENSAKYLVMTLDDAKLRWKEHVRKRTELDQKFGKMYWLLGRNSSCLYIICLLYTSRCV